MTTNIPMIDIKIKATHFEYVNRNAVRYTENAIKKGTPSWVKPYNKPQLVGHDKNTDPIGRIIDFEIIKSKTQSDEPPNYVRLIARITDGNAIEKILDGRYNTVSVGSRSSRVICSECSQVITEDGLCDHKKGSLNEKGEMIHWIVDQIDYTEDSFVNEPADDFTCIEEINVGNGWIDYKDFLDAKGLANSIKMEDCMSLENKDAKLSTEKRNKLSESTFCGPGRSFPAPDKAHVTAGLRLLNRSNFSESTKAKIKACLYRKGKRYGIGPSKDELQGNPDILTAGINDTWSAEQLLEIETFFKENPDADLPDANDTSEENTDKVIQEPVDLEKKEKNEIIDMVKKYQKDIETSTKEHTDAISTRDAKIIALEKKIEQANTLALQKEDEISRYLDDNAILTKKLRDSIISNIIDLKMADNNKEDRTVIIEKYVKRQTESLVDTLEDLRTNKTQTVTEGGVKDPTIRTDDSDKTKIKTDQNKSEENKFKLFERDRSTITED